MCWKIAINVVAVDDRGIKIKMWDCGKRGMTMNDDSNCFECVNIQY